jgi:hypothetical protein
MYSMRPQTDGSLEWTTAEVRGLHHAPNSTRLSRSGIAARAWPALCNRGTTADIT